MFQIAVPIIIQNGITNFVSLLDNIMVGQVGTLPMSGVSIVNQLIFVFNLCIFGASSGAGIFTAQFHGREDAEGVPAYLPVQISDLRRPVSGRGGAVLPMRGQPDRALSHR